MSATRSNTSMYPLKPPGMLNAALYYLEQGLSVIPLCVPDLVGGGCFYHGAMCPSPGKRPLIPWAELQKRRATEGEVRDWFGRRWMLANIGIATGAVSECVVIDTDSPEAEAIVEGHVGGLVVPSVRTGSGGRHFYFATPSEPIGNRVRVGGVPLDVRGIGGQVVVPPSLHSSGRPYEWITPLEMLPPLPAGLLALLETSRGSRRGGGGFETVTQGPVGELPVCATSSYGRSALLRATMRILRADEGARNDTLFAQAAAIFELVGGTEINEAEAFRELALAAHVAGLGGSETSRTLLSARKHGAAHPRHAPTRTVYGGFDDE